MRRWPEIGTANQLGHSNENTDVQLWLSPCRSTSRWTWTSIDSMISKRQNALLSSSICIPSRSQESTRTSPGHSDGPPCAELPRIRKFRPCVHERVYRRIAHRTINAGFRLLGGCPGLSILLSDLEWLVVKDLEPLEPASAL